MSIVPGSDPDRGLKMRLDWMDNCIPGLGNAVQFEFPKFDSSSHRCRIGEKSVCGSRAQFPGQVENLNSKFSLNWEKLKMRETDAISPPRPYSCLPFHVNTRDIKVQNLYLFFFNVCLKKT